MTDREMTDLLAERVMGWVHCDGCGNHGEPVLLSSGSDAIRGQWNKENPL